MAIQSDVLQSTPLISKSLPIRIAPNGNLLLLSQIARNQKIPLEDILPDSIIKECSPRSLHICDLGWIQCALLRNALKGIFCINAITFRKEEVAYIKHGEDDWVEITLKDGTKVKPRNEDENLIICWCFGGNPSGAYYTNIKKPMETEED